MFRVLIHLSKLKRRQMQHAAASVTVGAVQMADFAVRIVYKYQRLRVCQRHLAPKV